MTDSYYFTPPITKPEDKELYEEMDDASECDLEDNIIESMGGVDDNYRLSNVILDFSSDFDEEDFKRFIESTKSCKTRSLHNSKKDNKKKKNPKKHVEVVKNRLENENSSILEYSINKNSNISSVNQKVDIQSSGMISTDDTIDSKFSEILDESHKSHLHHKTKNHQANNNKNIDKNQFVYDLENMLNICPKTRTSAQNKLKRFITPPLNNSDLQSEAKTATVDKNNNLGDHSDAYRPPEHHESNVFNLLQNTDSTNDYEEACKEPSKISKNSFSQNFCETNNYSLESILKNFTLERTETGETIYTLNKQKTPFVFGDSRERKQKKRYGNRMKRDQSNKDPDKGTYNSLDIKNTNHIQNNGTQDIASLTSLSKHQPVSYENILNDYMQESEPESIPEQRTTLYSGHRSKKTAGTWQEYLRKSSKKKK